MCFSKVTFVKIPITLGENYDENNQLLDTESFPLISYGTDSQDERLFLTRKFTASVNDTGILCFYPDFTESFDVYRRGETLTVGVDYQISVDEGGTWEDTTSPVGVAKEFATCLIKLIILA